jgi:pyruvate formate lyase activating enzyme
MVLIGGLQKTSLVDYPGNIVATIFLQGCNFKCHFCHNPELLSKGTNNNISEEEVLSFLDSKKRLIDGVCITGGEPTIHNDLIDFIKKIKDKGFLVKLDTNGSNPDMVKELIDKKLVDYIAMDVKVKFDNYYVVAGNNINIEKIKKSIELIKESGINYEFRTTLHPSFHTKEDILWIAKYLKGAKKYVLQQFYFKNKIVNPKYKDIDPFSEEEIKEIKKECDRFLKTEIRV